jgi:hypothetical protein
LTELQAPGEQLLKFLLAQARESAVRQHHMNASLFGIVENKVSQRNQIFWPCYVAVAQIAVKLVKFGSGGEFVQIKIVLGLQRKAESSCFPLPFEENVLGEATCQERKDREDSQSIAD